MERELGAEVAAEKTVYDPSSIAVGLGCTLCLV